MATAWIIHRLWNSFLLLCVKRPKDCQYIGYTLTPFPHTVIHRTHPIFSKPLRRFQTFVMMLRITTTKKFHRVNTFYHMTPTNWRYKNRGGKSLPCREIKQRDDVWRTGSFMSDEHLFKDKNSNRSNTGCLKGFWKELQRHFG